MPPQSLAGVAATNKVSECHRQKWLNSQSDFHYKELTEEYSKQNMYKCHTLSISDYLVASNYGLDVNLNRYCISALCDK